MKANIDPDLTPLPKWRQRRSALAAWWKKTRNSRLTAYTAFKAAAYKLLILAITVLGGILISFGMHDVHPSAGYITGGFICWLLLWSHEQDKRRGQ